MNKFALALLAAAALPAVAFANETKKEAAPAPAAATVAKEAPAAGKTEAKKVELKDGSWAQIEGETVKVSKDGGKTWTDATDGTWEAKDGTKLTTKGGKIAK